MTNEEMDEDEVRQLVKGSKALILPSVTGDHSLWRRVADRLLVLSHQVVHPDMSGAKEQPKKQLQTPLPF